MLMLSVNRLSKVCVLNTTQHIYIYIWLFLFCSLAWLCHSNGPRKLFQMSIFGSIHLQHWYPNVNIRIDPFATLVPKLPTYHIYIYIEKFPWSSYPLKSLSSYKIEMAIYVCLNIAKYSLSEKCYSTARWNLTKYWLNLTNYWLFISNFTKYMFKISRNVIFSKWKKNNVKNHPGFECWRECWHFSILDRKSQIL